MLALAVLFAAVPARMPAHAENGDAARGQRVFQRCFACHSVDPKELNLPGPNLSGVVDRPSSMQVGFDYSEAMRNARLVWNERNIDAFIADPTGFLPGTLMAMPGISDSQDRRDVIAYLKALR